MTDRVKNARSTRGRPFPPGNPGRAKGSRNRATTLAEQLMGDDLEGVVEAVIAAAKSGDMVAARLVLERLAPARKGRPVTFKLPPDVDAAGLAAVFSAVLRAVSEGEVSPEEGQAIAGLLEARRKAIELAEVEARIKVLEERSGR
jgi:hypothetical protein